MTCRATRRDRVLVSRGVHPQYRQTLHTYMRNLELEEIPLVAEGEAAGTTDLDALARMLGEEDRPVAGVIAANPDFLGLLEPMSRIGELTHAAGALFVAVIEPVSLAVLTPPGAYGADIAAGEGQPLGIAPQYGGPYLGILASTDALVRQIPGRLVGMTTDLDGKRAFVMTLRAREQDIRRDKAASNICTNQALLALAASIYLATIGPHGLRDVAANGAARATELETGLAAIGVERVHPGPYLNEFAIRVADARTVHRRLIERGFLAGLVLADAEPDDPTLADGLLLATTELTTSGDIARFVAALQEVLSGRPPVGVETGAGAERAANPVGATR
jgi:glycine dehydrogenase subunit 1